MILVVSEKRSTAAAVADMLYFMGILSYPATPEMAVSEISDKYKAVLILSCQDSENENELTEILRSLFPEIPVFAHGKTVTPFIYDSVFESEKSIVEVIKSIKDIARENSLIPPGEYMNFSQKNSLFFEKANIIFEKFTRTERMIVNLLHLFFPSSATKEEILKYSFRSGRVPDVSSVRTHISLINKKSYIICGRKMIFSSSDGGYILN